METAFQTQVYAHLDYGCAAVVLAHILQCNLMRGPKEHLPQAKATDKYMFFTLPHELGFMVPEEPIHLVIIATMTTKTGWRYIYEKLDIETTDENLDLSDPGHSLEVDMFARLKQWKPEVMPMVMQNLVLTLHYCKVSHQCGELLSTPERIPSSEASNEGLLTLLAEARYMSKRNYSSLNETVFGHSTFSTCLVYLAAWANNNGILAADLGLLSIEMLMVQLDKAQEELTLDCKNFVRNGEMTKQDLRKLIETCMYPLLLGTGAANHRISIIHPASQRNLAANMSIDTSRTIKRAIQRSVGPDFVWSHNVEEGKRFFLEEFEFYIRVSFVCWDPKKLDQFHQVIKQILVNAQSMVYKHTSSRLGAVLWPHHFGSPFQLNEMFYTMIGVHREQGATVPQVNDRGKLVDVPEMAKSVIEARLYDALNEQEAYDTDSCYVHFDLQTRDEAYEAFDVPRKMAPMVNTSVNMPFDWILSEKTKVLGTSVTRSAPEAAAPEATARETAATRDEVSAAIQVSESSDPPSSSSGPTIAPEHESIMDPAQLNPTARFRSAAQVMTRLMFDPAHRGTFYEVEYTDRFAGLTWKSLDLWQKNTEEEDFIPTHRVKRIRRKGDEVIVWDREFKYDGTGQYPYGNEGRGR